MTDLELLSQRLARVENRFRWMTRAAVMLALIVAGGVATGQGIQELRMLEKAQGQPVAVPKTPIEEQVRARHFVLVDEKGKERASLVADNAGSVFLVMFDGTGKTRANLSVTNDGPSLVLYDAGSQQRTIIGSTTLVGSHVNENGIAEKAPPSSIVMFDKSGKLLWRQP